MKQKFKPKPPPPPPIRADRCANCYQWTEKIGGIGVFTPLQGEPIHYVVCPRCANRLNRNPRDQEALRKIESYITEQSSERSTK